MSDSPAARHPRLGDRRLFPDLEAGAYLAHAAISPPSTAVRDAATAVLETYARRGLAGFGIWRDQRERLRVTIAGLAGADPDEVAFVPNTTQGVLDVALCLPWRSGDRIVLYQGEFPANVTPWQQAAELFELEIDWLPVDPFMRSHEEGLAALRAALEGGARLVASSFVQFQTGLRMPVERMADLCHSFGAELFVDGIQGCGIVPLDLGVSGIDYLSCGSHKWLMGPEGAGFLYVRGDRLRHLRPRVAGWLSHEDPFAFLFEGRGHLRYDRPIRHRADFVEAGAPNATGLAGLGAAVELLTHLGLPQIYDHVQRYLDASEAPLVDRGFRSLRATEAGARSGILSLEVPTGVDATRLVVALGRRGVACTAPDGLLRLAPHWPNDAESEVPLVLRLLDEAMAESRSP